MADELTSPAKPGRTPYRDHRGLRNYTEFADTRGCTVRVKQSSAFGLRHCWVFCTNTTGAYTDRSTDADAPVHLTVAQARRLAAALLRFVKEAQP